MGRSNILAWTALCLLLNSFDLVQSHGRLLQPAARSSLWRFSEYSQLNPPINYNDNELNCGGIEVQYSEQNGGKCGECGDAYNLTRPRDQETGGKYGRGIIARSYSAGDMFEIYVQLTANHMGYFEFRLCCNNDPSSPVEQECLDQNILEIESSGQTKYYVQSNVSEYRYNLKLPPNLTGSHCVLQWQYRAGNNWGTCPDGSGALGCGPQETFRNCADIVIS